MKMRVLFVHNAYQQHGGEDSVVDSEIDMLHIRGHSVESYRRHNNEIQDLSRLNLAFQTLWSSRTVDEVGKLITSFQPDVIHAHNTFPLISPSLYWAASRARVPIVQTLHNFRLLCPQAMLLRNGRVCEECIGHLPWRGVTRRCYRASASQSAVLAAMLTLHRGLGTYAQMVTRFIVLNGFCREKFIAGGLPGHKVVVKPNFVDWPSIHGADIERIRSSAIRPFLLVGRLSFEKGLAVLSQALNHAPDVQLRVAGEGPDATHLRSQHGVTMLGALTSEQVRTEMVSASALVMPSIWYENFPRTLVEAFACCLPVIASRLGAMAELIEDGRTGLLFTPGDGHDLSHKMMWARAHPDEMLAMGKRARREYEMKYTPEINYRQLLSIYDDAIDAFRAES